MFVVLNSVKNGLFSNANNVIRFVLWPGSRERNLSLLILGCTRTGKPTFFGQRRGELCRLHFDCSQVRVCPNVKRVFYFPKACRERELP
jgi:hypothetical protein